ncbi:hypothetical protein N7468_009512 [Penicillium chermesinum]|uniref:Uncharacterized protein n=1 Tax=Penicillium chermesinum TaxID=63820 RepID=A0A9W9TF29_9EURO|nr:uncharacterized protein N7468_009512 [Penicillium chermesinum]KAJ5220308.1 hypothetical protein N7468_009512 [Penicillium chermesinum]
MPLEPPTKYLFTHDPVTLNGSVPEKRKSSGRPRPLPVSLKAGYPRSCPGRPPSRTSSIGSSCSGASYPPRAGKRKRVIIPVSSLDLISQLNEEVEDVSLEPFVPHFSVGKPQLHNGSNSSFHVETSSHMNAEHQVQPTRVYEAHTISDSNHDSQSFLPSKSLCATSEDHVYAEVIHWLNDIPEPLGSTSPIFNGIDWP